MNVMLWVGVCLPTCRYQSNGDWIWSSESTILNAIDTDHQFVGNWAETIANVGNWTEIIGDLKMPIIMLHLDPFHYRVCSEEAAMIKHGRVCCLIASHFLVFCWVAHVGPEHIPHHGNEGNWWHICSSSHCKQDFFAEALQFSICTVVLPKMLMPGSCWQGMGHCDVDSDN